MKKVGFLFPGQGSQYVGMGQELYDNFNIARECFEKANSVIGFDLKELCFNGDIKTLTLTENAQPAILTTSIATYKVLTEHFKISPAFVAGHSLGEFSALVCSGTMNFEDALKIVRQRGFLMKGAISPGEGSMVAVVGVDSKIVETICENSHQKGEVVSIANYNSPNQVVISGHKNAVEKAKKDCEELGAKTVVLQVSSPFHTEIMRTAAYEFEKELNKYEYNRFKYPVISNLTALPYSQPRYIVPYMTDQMHKSVQWNKSIEFMINQGVDTFIEIGPKKVLRKLIFEINNNVSVYSFETPEDISLIKTADIEDRPDKIGLITSCIAAAVSTKNRNWDNWAYEKGVVLHYKEVQKMREDLLNSGAEPTIEEIEKAINMLKSVFEIKLVPIDEQKERLSNIFASTHTEELFSKLIY